MTRLTRQGVAFESDKACQAAFDRLKEAKECLGPVLAMPVFSKPLNSDCDCIRRGHGLVLEHDSHPVANQPRKLARAERNCTVGEQQLLAVMHAMKVWRCYLLGVCGEHFGHLTNLATLTLFSKHNLWPLPHPPQALSSRHYCRRLQDAEL